MLISKVSLVTVVKAIIKRDFHVACSDTAGGGILV